MILAAAGSLVKPADAARPTSSVTAPITAAASGGVLDGVATISSFTVDSAGQLVAHGIYQGTVTMGGVPQTVTSTFSAIVSDMNPPGRCTILDLTLGPLHLDLLGLIVDLNQVHLVISAQPGPGNLLGNLLCSITHLLDKTPVPAVQMQLQHLNELLASP